MTTYLWIVDRIRIDFWKLKLKMALKLSAAEAANVAIQSIGCGYDLTLDLSLNNRKRRYLSDIGSNPYRNCRLIEIEEEEGRDILLPGGLLLVNVSKSIKCDEGDYKRLQSDVLSFREMSEEFNEQISLSGKIPSGLFNSMFEFSGNWAKDASSAKTLAFDGVFYSLYTVALEKSEMLLCDHVKKAVPSSWEPALLARFIEKFGTHIIVGVKMGGKDVIYMKQHYGSSLDPADVQKRLEEMAHNRFLDDNGQFVIDSEYISQIDKDLISICKRRGGSDDRNLKHEEWLHTVQLEPDVITMSFIPITSLLNGLRGRGFLSHAINLYLRCEQMTILPFCLDKVNFDKIISLRLFTDKPPLEELPQFLEFQVPRYWNPVFRVLSVRPQPEQQSTTSLQFSFFGPKLYVNTNPVDVGKLPVTGLRLYLIGERFIHLEIHLQHLSNLPKFFKLEDSVTGIFNSDSDDRRYYEKVQGKNFDHVCTSPVESEDEYSIVTGAQLQVRDHGSKKVLFLRLYFSKLLGCTANRNPEWDDGSPGLKLKLESSISSTEVLPRQFEVPHAPVHPLSQFKQEKPEMMRKLLKFVDTTEMQRGPEESPGYWVVTGARLVVDQGKISLRVKYSLPQMFADEVVAD